MNQDILSASIDILAKRFEEILWKHLDVPVGSPEEKTQLWPGEPDEDITLCVYKGREYMELFHRQDYFFFNFAYQGDYQAIIYKHNMQITIAEGECYFSQPYTGYAIRSKSKEDTIIVGVLIQKEAFFKTYFHVLSADRKLFQFFLNPQINAQSEEYIHLKFQDDFAVRRLLELIMVEYADIHENTQEVLKPLTLALLMQVARQYAQAYPNDRGNTLSEQIVQYIGAHLDSVSLNGVAQHFNYHPNYLSSLLPRELGKSFSEILL